MPVRQFYYLLYWSGAFGLSEALNLSRLGPLLRYWAARGRATSLLEGDCLPLQAAPSAFD